MSAVVSALKKKKRTTLTNPRNGKAVSPAVQKAFIQQDRDDSGYIDSDETEKALNSMGMPVGAELADQILKQYSDGKEEMTIFDFDILVEDLRGFERDKETFVRSSILGKDKPLPYQKEARALYLNPIVVWSVAAIIIANFVINIVEKEIDPENDELKMKHKSTWEALDLIFNIIFLFELLLNMYGYGGPVRAFWNSPWNVFDTIIVTVGILLLIPGFPPSMSKLKLLRAFRVFRLFKRIQSLNKIIVALGKAVPGVTNAFVILFIFFCIYAILAVELFRDFGVDGMYETGGPFGANGSVSSETARGFANGREYYGTYTKAMYTLFQVMTGESWSEAVARPLLFGLYDDAWVVGIFYVTFVILTQMVLINVVVAVLLDNFVTGDSNEPLLDEKSAAEFLSIAQERHGSVTKASASSGAASSSCNSQLKDAAAGSSSTPSAQDAAAESSTNLSARVGRLEVSLQELHDKLDSVLSMHKLTA